MSRTLDTTDNFRETDSRNLQSDYFEGRCTELAKSLIGNLLLYESPEGVTGGLIVETEAYLGANDPACHLASGRTKRNKPFFRGMGTVYVFKIYHHSNLNIITEYNSNPECILIRAIHPLIGLDLMKERRGVNEQTEIASGPGKLTEALGITKENLNDTPLDESPLEIRDVDRDGFDVVRTARIGLSKAENWPLRYVLKDSEYLSKQVHQPLDLSLDLDDYYNDLKMQTNRTLPESI